MPIYPQTTKQVQSSINVNPHKNVVGGEKSKEGNNFVDRRPANISLGIQTNN